jgi:hypothetical protein
MDVYGEFLKLNGFGRHEFLANPLYKLKIERNFLKCVN